MRCSCSGMDMAQCDTARSHSGRALHNRHQKRNGLHNLNRRASHLTISPSLQAAKEDKAPRAKSAYQFYCDSIRDAVKAEPGNADLKMTDFAKLFGERWAKLSAKDKAVSGRGGGVRRAYICIA